MQTKRYVKIKEIARLYGVSDTVVKEDWVDGQMLKYGKHYIDVRSQNAKNAQLRFDLDACQKYFEIEPEKR